MHPFLLFLCSLNCFVKRVCPTLDKFHFNQQVSLSIYDWGEQKNWLISQKCIQSNKEKLIETPGDSIWRWLIINIPIFKKKFSKVSNFPMQDSVFLICFNIFLEQTEMLLPKIHNSQIKLKCILIITLAFQRLMLRFLFPLLYVLQRRSSCYYTGQILFRNGWN